MTILFFTPLVMLIFSLLNHIGVMMQSMQDPSFFSAFSIVNLVWFFIGSVYVLFMIVPNAAISARRLHDINISGKWLWFVYIPLIIQVVIRLAKTFVDIESISFDLMISLLVIRVVLGAAIYTARIVFITLHSLKSDVSDNRFGSYLKVGK